MTIKQFMRMFRFIHEDEVKTVALEVYKRNCTEEATGEKDFYYRSGVANAVGFICGRLGIDITKAVREECD